MHPVFLSLLFTLAAYSQTAEPTNKSLYERLGGKTGITELSNTFINELSGDARLTKNPDIHKVSTTVGPMEAKRRLNLALCQAAGGPCKAPKEALLKGVPPDLELDSIEWFYIAQDANRAMDQKKVGLRERKDLLGLLMKARKNE